MSSWDIVVTIKRRRVKKKRKRQCDLYFKARRLARELLEGRVKE
jgi:hypothetical protein